MNVLFTQDGASCQQGVHTFFPDSTGFTWQSMHSSSVGTAKAPHLVVVDSLADSGKCLPA